MKGAQMSQLGTEAARRPKNTAMIAVAGLMILASSAVASPAMAAPAAKTLETFGPAEVTATADSATIILDDGEWGGVYIKSKSKSGKLLSQVDFSFTSTGAVSGGAPRFSLPIDTDGNGTVDGYAFIDAANCGGISGGETVVSTDAENCQAFFGSGSYANWDALAAANPTYRMAPGSIPFVIADGGVGTYRVEDIVLR